MITHVKREEKKEGGEEKRVKKENIQEKGEAFRGFGSEQNRERNTSQRKKCKQ
jgi:hypothetical protein